MKATAKHYKSNPKSYAKKKAYDKKYNKTNKATKKRTKLKKINDFVWLKEKFNDITIN